LPVRGKLFWLTLAFHWLHLLALQSLSGALPDLSITHPEISEGG